MRQTIQDREKLSILHSLLAPEIYARLADQPNHKSSKAKSQKRKEKKEKKKKAGEVFHVVEEKEDEGFFVSEPQPTARKNSNSGNDSDNQLSDDKELGEFVDYIASALLTSLPSHTTEPTSDEEDSTYPSTPISSLPSDLLETLTTYTLFPTLDSASTFLSSILSAYTASTAPSSETKPITITACELCHRSHLPLTAHHLVPRSAAPKAIKRGWRTEEEARTLAWICRSCHSFVHRVESNEGLARSYYTVELLSEREDVGRWVEWVGRQRWGLRKAYGS